MEIKDFINNSIESKVSGFKHTPSDMKLEIVSDGTGDPKLTNIKIKDNFMERYLTLTPDELNDFIRLLIKHKNFIDGNLRKVGLINE
jgi:hypothetical protein